MLPQVRQCSPAPPVCHFAMPPIDCSIAPSAPRVVAPYAHTLWDAALGDGIVVSGAALGEVGLALPVLAPAQGFLLHLEGVDA